MPRLTDVAIVLACAAMLGGCTFRLWAFFAGPCSGTLGAIPAWCFLLGGGR